MQGCEVDAAAADPILMAVADAVAPSMPTTVVGFITRRVPYKFLVDGVAACEGFAARDVVVLAEHEECSPKTC